MLIRNLDAFTRALGVENTPAIFSFSLLPWQSDAQRDAFIKDLVGIDLRKVNSYGS